MHSTSTLIESLHQGETPIQHAPNIRLENGSGCIPQHYLSYQHTLNSVEKIVLDIQYWDRYPIFVDEDNGGIYIQIGIIGRDNYDYSQGIKKQKLTYGRKWRVEASLPTSEIIQTVFLALKKSREHEVRELFRVSHQKAISTPFNTHHDLPLMSRNSDLLQLAQGDSPAEHKQCKEVIEGALAKISYDHATVTLHSLEQRSTGQWLIDLVLTPHVETSLPELKNMTITLLSDVISLNNLYFSLMDYFVSLSDKHLDENFYYRQFARFSRENNVIAIAELSVATRKKNVNQNKDFLADFAKLNYDTDKTRVPKLTSSILSETIKRKLGKFAPLEGFLPL